MILLRDQAALLACAEALDPIAAFAAYTYAAGRRIYLTRKCGDCHGRGGTSFPGEGPLGTDLWTDCETCGGGGMLPEED